MVKIRLERSGKKNAPFYRIVAIDERRRPGGKPLEVLGFWQPSKDSLELKKEAIKKWTDKGAVVTSAVKKLL